VNGSFNVEYASINALDIQNHEKQKFYKNIKVTQQGINVTLNSFLPSVELKRSIYFRHHRANKILFVDEV
jgi:hypothetical protein